MTSSCPDETTLAAFVDGALDTDRHAAVVAHAADCGRCAELLASEARAAQQGAATVPPALLALAHEAGASAPRQDGPSRWFRPAAAAAAVLLATVVWQGLPPGSTDAPATSNTVPARPNPGSEASSPRERRAVQADAVAAPHITTPIDGAIVAAVPFELAWTPVAHGLGYEVQLLGAAGEILWQVATETTRVTVAADALVPGHTYYLRVAATLPDGRRVPSPAVGFQFGGTR